VEVIQLKTASNGGFFVQIYFGCQVNEIDLSNNLLLDNYVLPSEQINL